MEFLGLIGLALVALWMLAVLGWIIPLLAFVLLRKTRFARAFGVISIVCFISAVLVGIATYPSARSMVGSTPRSISAEEMQSFAGMYEVDREEYGLTPIDGSARVLLERRSGSDAHRCGYDAMLHMYSPHVSRTVTFALRDGEYVWIGEQEIHYSGRTYRTVDGDVEESIVITYSKDERPGTQKGLRVDYSGDNEALESKFDLTLEDVRPVLRKWDEERQK